MKTNQILLIKAIIWERDIIWLSKKLIYFISPSLPLLRISQSVWTPRLTGIGQPISTDLHHKHETPPTTAQNNNKARFKLPLSFWVYPNQPKCRPSWLNIFKEHRDRVQTIGKKDHPKMKKKCNQNNTDGPFQSQKWLLPKIYWQSVFFRQQTYFLTKWDKKQQGLSYVQQLRPKCQN